MPQLPYIYPHTSLIPLVVHLYDGKNYSGLQTTLLEDPRLGDLKELQFYRKASAIGVHPGPDYYAIKTYPPTVTFWSEKDGYLVLGIGAYPELETFGFDNLISNVSFNYTEDVAVQTQSTGRYGPGGKLLVRPRDVADAAPINKIALVVDSWTKSIPDNSRPFNSVPAGAMITLIESNRDLRGTLGTSLPGGGLTITRIRQGSAYTGFEVVRFWRENDFGQGNNSGYTEFGPTYEKDKYTPEEFVPIGTLPVKSIQFTQPPIHPPKRYAGPLF